MHIKKLPEVLFKEIAAKYGKGQETEIFVKHATYKDIYRGFYLDEEKVGFKGAIGYTERHEHNIFVLWDFIWDNSGDENARLKIVAGPQQSSTWAYGRGESIKELAFATPAFPGSIYLHHPSTKIVAEILSRANLLASDPKTQQPSYWEKDKYPNQDYSKP